jgi:general secretion pathway protein L
LSRYALVADDGGLLQQGEGALRGLGDLIASSRRVLLIVAAADVTLLQVQAPPLSAARLKAALPSLVEEHILGDPTDCVLVAAPAQGETGMRTVAVVQRAWLEPLVRGVLAQGARSVAAVPAQLCLPLQPGNVTAAIADGQIIVRHAQYQGLGIAMHSPPGVALQTVRSLAGDSPLTLYVPHDELGEYQALAAEAGPGMTIEADHWNHWLAGSRTTTFDLVPGLGAAGARTRDWSRWRWPLRLAALAIIVNLAGLNIEWLRLKREAEATRASMLQTYKAAYPKDTVIQDPLLQMQRNVAAAKAAGGAQSPDEFTYLAAALGESLRAIGRNPDITGLDYRERVLTVKVKPESTDPGFVSQLKNALAQRKLELSESGPATWAIRSTGGKS